MACTLTVAASVMWWGAPDYEFTPASDAVEETADAAPVEVIRIAAIEQIDRAAAEEPPAAAELPDPPEAAPPVPKPEPTEAMAPAEEAEPVETTAQAAELPLEPEAEPIDAVGLQEEATLQAESDLPEGLPLADVVPEPPAEIERAEVVEAVEPDPPAIEASASEPELSALESAELPAAEAELAPAQEVAEALSQTTEPAPGAPPDATAEVASAAPRTAAADPTPAPIEPVDDVSMAIGRHRIEHGRYPHQRASYARIGFERYRDAMLALGGSFYIFDARQGRVLAELDPHSLATRAVERPPAHQSRWPRDVTRYLGSALRDPSIAARYPQRGLRVVLLPPADLDAAFVGGLDRALRREGIDIERVTQVRLIYELTESGLECEVAKVALRDGSERSMKLRLALSGPIPDSRRSRSSGAPLRRGRGGSQSRVGATRGAGA